MPAATEQPAAKKEHDELLWQALKEHIMRERQKKKQGKTKRIMLAGHHNEVRQMKELNLNCLLVFVQNKRPKWKRSGCVKSAKNAIDKMP